jgi:large subunit ribosomal protein L32
MIVIVNKTISIIKLMAVPKKRTSKSRKNARKAVWKRKANKQAEKAFSLAKSILSSGETSFRYKVAEENE